jgi:hypothetical protein
MSKMAIEVAEWVALVIWGAGIITGNKDVTIIGLSCTVMLNLFKGR